ncbi:uncharacterized protein LOC143304943 [Bombus vancouverensis nearcticus]|uniref:uncharacterized protein LOC143304943 n=1 Tax=Bombus vancouverensis nearcticus TaxID=2705178 RepID=UPI00402B467F
MCIMHCVCDRYCVLQNPLLHVRYNNITILRRLIHNKISFYFQLIYLTYFLTTFYTYQLFYFFLLICDIHACTLPCMVINCSRGFRHLCCSTNSAMLPYWLLYMVFRKPRSITYFARKPSRMMITCSQGFRYLYYSTNSVTLPFDLSTI